MESLMFLGAIILSVFACVYTLVSIVALSLEHQRLIGKDFKIKESIVPKGILDGFKGMNRDIFKR